MSIEINEQVTDECQDVEKGILFTLLKTTCASPPLLQHITPAHSDEDKKLPKSTKRVAYDAMFRGQKLIPCNEDFADEKGKLLRLGVRMVTKCPFFGHAGAKYRVRLDYIEAIGPSNLYKSPIYTEIRTIYKTVGVDIGTYTTVSIGDHFGFGSSGKGTATLKLSIVDPEPDNPCIIPAIRLDAHLVNLGRSYDFLSGTPINQVRTKDCTSFVQGLTGMSGFWTGLSYAFGPIGLVMTLSYEVYGGFGFVD